MPWFVVGHNVNATVWYFLNVIADVNTCVNPFLYALHGENFRMTLRRTLCGSKCCPKRFRPRKDEMFSMNFTSRRSTAATPIELSTLRTNHSLDWSSRTSTPHNHMLDRSSRTPTHHNHSLDWSSRTPTHHSLDWSSRTPTHHNHSLDRSSRTPTHHNHSLDRPSRTPTHHNHSLDRSSRTPTHHNHSLDWHSRTPPTFRTNVRWTQNDSMF
ncbi:uncharacterized protein [Branchiostoma lanceolatum]|uniref:uncharacterized protein n=1 Tax=Branchiostoma lanceolatum TaxID=7740 RepID=UPI00345377E8